MNKEYTTTGGYDVKHYTTKELAKLILTTPNTMFSFCTSLTDMEKTAELNVDTPVDPWPWYGIVSTRIFDVQSVFINRLTLCGGAPFTIDLPDYEEGLDIEFDEEQCEECYDAMIEGLAAFNLQYGELSDTWYVRDDAGVLRVENYR